MDHVESWIEFFYTVFNWLVLCVHIIIFCGQRRDYRRSGLANHGLSKLFQCVPVFISPTRRRVQRAQLFGPRQLWVLDWPIFTTSLTDDCTHTSVLTLSQICLQELHRLHSFIVECVFSWLNSVCARVCFCHPRCDLIKPESEGFLHYIAFRQWLHLNCREQVRRGQYGVLYFMSQTHRSETTF